MQLRQLLIQTNLGITVTQPTFKLLTSQSTLQSHKTATYICISNFIVLQQKQTRIIEQTREICLTMVHSHKHHTDQVIN